MQEWHEEIDGELERRYAVPVGSTIRRGPTGRSCGPFVRCDSSQITVLETESCTYLQSCSLVRECNVQYSEGFV